MADTSRITAAYLHSRMDYEPETGFFRWKPRLNPTEQQRKWNIKYAGMVAGCIPSRPEARWSREPNLLPPHNPRPLMSRSTTWHALCVQVDPDFVRDARLVVEYEFSSPGWSRTGNERTHSEGRRIFKGDYQTRGPYVAETVATGGLTWRDVPLTWDDEDLTWTP